MSSSIDIFFYAAGACVCLCLAIVTYIMATPDRAQVSALGARGYQRQVARKNPLFLVVEPALRLVATWVYPFPIGDFRKGVDQLLTSAGDFLGLSADEFIAMCLLSGVAGAVVIGQMSTAPIVLVCVAGMISLLPYVAVSGIRDTRAVAVTRAMPTAIELMALCVSAGMDFPGALREIVGNNAAEDDVLNSEFRKLLRDLDLGHSRKRALLAFGERVAGDGVADFVAALIQSEEKGNPLKEVLAAQAKVLRVRRSFRAEEMATQAGVKMVIPLAILMMMILIIIIAPLMLKMQQEGF